MGLIDAIPLPALRLDGRRRIREANRAAVRLFARAREKLVGRSPSRIARPEALAAAVDVPLAKGSLLLFADTGVVERLQQQVYHLSRLSTAGRLVAVVVHEINNALAGILGYAQFLLAQTSPPEVRRDLERIHDEALRTARVAQNLLRFSRGGRGERTTVHLDELLSRCAELKRRDFALRAIQLKLDVAAGLPPLVADEALLSQVFINLMNNAQQSISGVRSRGVVAIRARVVNRRLVVDVADDGPGIPKNMRERVFDAFFTARATGDGTGLGLTLCREILRDHGGEIKVAPRRTPGACLRIVFPIKAAAARKPSTNGLPHAQVVVENRRIVVIEDEPSVREVVARTFSGRGNHIITFERGEDALSYLAAEPVDLVVSDIHRPGLDGMRLFEQLARVRPGLLARILFITGDTFDEEVAAFLRRSHAHALPKPLRLDDLQRAAHAIVERAVNQGELFHSNGACAS